MNTIEYENLILENVKKRMRMAKSTNTVNKLYRHARVWAYFHCVLGEGCSEVRLNEIYETLKEYRNKYRCEKE